MSELALSSKTILFLRHLGRRLKAFVRPESKVNRFSTRLEEKDLDLVARIEWIIRLRWLVTLVVPAIVFILIKEQILQQLDDKDPLMERLAPNLTLAGINFILNIFYSLALRRGWRLQFIAQAQVFLDTVIFSLTVYTTGGVASPFTFVYFNPILTACLLLSFQAGLFIASVTSLLFTGMIFLQGRNLIPIKAVFIPLADMASENAGYTLLMGVVWVYAFFLVAVLSGLLSQVLKKKELALQKANQNLDSRVNELSLLFDVASLINRQHSLNRILQETLNLLVVRMDFDRALLYLVDERGEKLRLKLLSRHPRYSKMPPESYTVEMPLKKEAGITARAAVEQRLYNITDPLDHPLINRDLAKKIGLNPFAVAPMLVRKKVVGVIGVDHKYSGGVISESEAKSLVIFANQAGLTIDNARLMARNRTRGRATLAIGKASV